MYHHRVSVPFALALSLLLCGSTYLLCDATASKSSSSSLSSSTTIIKKTKMTSKLY